MENEKFDLKHIHRIETSAKVLFKILQSKFDGEIRDMKAVSDRIQQFNAISDSFNRRFTDYLKNLLRDQSKSEVLKPVKKGKLKLASFIGTHEILNQFKGLLSILKETGPSLHADILSFYQNEYGK